LERIKAICTERLAVKQGANGVGPARQEKSTTAARKSAGGKPRDPLVDGLIIEAEELVPSSAKGKTLIFCVGCLKKTVGRDPHRVRAHAKGCSVSPLYHRVNFEKELTAVHYLLEIIRLFFYPLC
jgi:hypothetical protein